LPISKAYSNIATVNEKTTPCTPQLVINDCWLEPQTHAITKRIERFDSQLQAINEQHKSLLEFSSLHLSLGIHYHAASQTWHIAEWAPQAKSLSPVGASNQGDKNTQPPAGNSAAFWHLTLPQNLLHHEASVKFVIE